MKTMNKENWDKIFSEGRDFTPLNIIFLDKLLERIGSLNREVDNDKEAENVIDLGAGTGDAAIKFVEKGLTVQIIDWSEVALEKAKNSAKEKGLENKITFTQMDLENLESEKLIYSPPDIIFCKLTYSFVKNKDNFLESVKNIMAPSTILVIMTPVLYSNIQYNPEDKPKIAVDYENTFQLFQKKFSYIEIFHHDYFGTKEDQVTFLIKK